ncbi:TldD/PmbA family protein [Candidatus Dependentiae bacterium]|nr:TldD/PmbA family protein [Candidatus Dependentiae bacterium]
MKNNFEQLIKKGKIALKKSGVKYGEIRIEEYTGSNISIVGKEVEDVKTSENLGGCCRALYSNGWGFVSFNDIDNVSSYYNESAEQSKCIKSKKIELLKIPVVKDYDIMKPADSPEKYNLSEKYKICKNYNDILKKNKKLQTSSVRYRDTIKKTLILTTEGSEIYSETAFCGIAVTAMARDGINIQSGYFTRGDYQGFEKNIIGLEEQCRIISDRAVRLLSAEPVKPGKYTIIIDPVLCGVFAHEAFGHLSEADFIYENQNMKRIMKIGRKFGINELNIIDDPTIPNLAGSYKYDSECVKSKKTYLIKNGILTGRLHSRETAFKLKEKTTGNCRAISFGFPPIVRMSNTYIDKGKYSFKDILEKTESGIYAKGSIGGMTNTEMFTFSSEEAFLIEEGKITKPLRDVILSGNVFETLKNIDMIGNDLKHNGGLGGCGKAGQSPLPVTDGGPHIRIKDVVIGGK